ncbi:MULTISPECIES: xanthine dehydrogenase family protein molybdopterin-binding subunit [Acidiphilium]|uniref:Carbon-monoxide dehydrogenase large subunit n=1 Tax=Acidiphilium rubrum TaxID=526 RepID=A0A8G2CLU3_ACIRU|nr:MULTISPECIES: xanthine dehydrogenase family protein molybdopterin-binding subunit [Acidiphilium]OYW01673.1 MAG: carbon monoxide dehydrogenase [Acidiphilium sp. 37-64-53]OZB30026.1 MAG: carbon monoxide dehydrogenase [Acidiphilium sp. 34-64-41]SIR09753.1 carbon-monoxide dehydrogenase large subunit [Acidiphilium rubrum]HQT83690.1 xanthine dehydrogenase family protein molybdopterin-binding subunit [Acidiphilium rubrum]
MVKFGVAQPVKRVEDSRLLRGAGQYTDDVPADGALIVQVVRSPHAAATITAIDVAAARAMPGVVGVFTGADLAADGIGAIPCMVPIKNQDGSPRAQADRPVLAGDAVRHVGEAVAFVVAETAQAARDAAEAVDITYDMKQSVTNLATAMDAGVAQVWDDAPHNQVFDWAVGDAAAVDALFAKAAHVTKLRVVNNRIVVNSMEPRAARASFEDDRWTLTTNTQGGWMVKGCLAQAVFKVEPDRFRVITPDVGGGFGMKLFVYPEHVMVCYAARKLGRAVKWNSERGEAFLSDTHGRDNVAEAELAIDADHRFLAMKVRNIANMGAYLSNFGPFIPTMAGTKVLAGVYGFQAIHAQVLGVFTNTVPVDAYRGAGRPESNYLVERLIDAAARELGMDRAQLRRLNFVPASAMPYRSAMNQPYDSGDFHQVLERALDIMDWEGFATRRAKSVAAGKRRGIGMAYYLEATGGAPEERAEIRFTRDGFVDVFVGTQSTGQGHETAYVQLVGDRLGIDPDRIRVRQGDTDTIPQGGGTGGARSLYSEGQAIALTTTSIIEKGRKAAADHLEAAMADIVFEEGKFTIVGTDRSIDIVSLAETLHAEGGNPLDTAEIAKIDKHTFPNGCHIAEVEIDPETGVVSVVRYLVCDDVGTIVNPMIVRGQVHGGVAQGMGQALLENTAYDDETGQLISGSMMDYALPRADDLPDIEVEFVEIPCASNPLGVKGAGEAGAVGSPPALINAVIDALADDGVRSIDMPATPERVWEAIAQGRRAA